MGADGRPSATDKSFSVRDVLNESDQVDFNASSVLNSSKACQNLCEISTQEAKEKYSRPKKLKILR